MPTYEIWITKCHTGDKHELIYTYHNKGHALAKIRGLLRKAWKYRSEMTYCLCQRR